MQQKMQIEGTDKKEPLPEDGSIDAGLLLLSMVKPPEGKVWSLYDIATACGTNHERIRWIEKQALKKMRIEMEKRGISPLRNA